MSTLQRILAQGVVKALRDREHILVAAGSTGALHDEVEAVIAGALPAMAPYLVAAHAALGEASFGDEHADALVEAIVDAIGERLLRSDHVDDIFATDGMIRRDAFRALRDILLRYLGGELSTEEDAEGEQRHTVALDGLGYVASMVARRADEATLTTVLERAAREASATLAHYGAARREAVFVIAAQGGGSLLALEEAITEAAVDLVEQDRVELPGLQQLLEVDAAVAEAPCLVEALATAAADVQQRTGCLATCTMVDGRTLLATLTPLSFEGAELADAHFAQFVATLEASLSLLLSSDAAGADPAAQDVESTRRARGQRSSRRPRESAAAPPSGDRRTSARPRSVRKGGVKR